MYNSQEIANRIKLRIKSQGYTINGVLSECSLGKKLFKKVLMSCFASYH